MNRVSKQPQGRRLFSFAVVADTHVNETDDASGSPFLTNAHANNRARHVFSEIAKLTPAPEFVVHLGDMVHPVPGLPSFEEATARFKEIVALAPMPVHVVPGNHDIGDKSIDWMPADIVCDDYVEKYRRIFGPDYFSFDHGGIKFIVINSLLFNSGLASEETQKQWLENEIARAGKRAFVFTHYPPYLYDPAERGSYDNIDEPGRSWLLERLKNAKIEAVFCGHVHNFWYDVVGNAELYMLPSTAFLRHDFTEFYRVAASMEYGRGDQEKLGYFLIDVYEQGHVAHLVRTHGEMLEENLSKAPKWLVSPVHTKTSALNNFGVELRHAWTEVVQIPCTGGVQEFGRKHARNDYQLMAMWEMGLRTLKVPEQDMRDAKTVARAQLMSDVGHDFIITTLGVPGEAFISDIVASQVNVSAIELNLPMEKFIRRSSDIARLRKLIPAKIILSKLRTTEDSHFDGQHFSHFVHAGIRLDELPSYRDQLAALVRDGIIDGITVRLDRGTDIVAAAARLEQFSKEIDCDIIASVKLAGDNLARASDDDFDTARLAAEAFIASKSSQRVRYVFDTFMDVDRGYFPRNGFIDRRFDPRAAAVAVTSLAASLPGANILSIHRADDDGGCRNVDFGGDGSRYSLLCGAVGEIASRLDKVGWTRCINLLTREIIEKGKGDKSETAFKANSGERALILVYQS